MALQEIGVSSYPSLKGTMQYMDQQAARQLNKLNSLFAERFGYRFSPNEGVRSKERQDLLWNRWVSYQNGGPVASLAARPYSSTHDPSRGSAVDIGVTREDGTNRALSPAEHEWLRANGPALGVIWTGGDPNFMSPAEWWHFNVYPERATTIVSANDEASKYDGDDELTPDEKRQLKRVDESVEKILQAMGREEKRSAKFERVLVGPKSDLAKIKNSVGALVKKLIG